METFIITLRSIVEIANTTPEATFIVMFSAAIIGGTIANLSGN